MKGGGLAMMDRSHHPVIIVGHLALVHDCFLDIINTGGINILERLKIHYHNS